MDHPPLIEIGKYNKLTVLKSTPQGLYVGDDIEEILLPNKYIPEGADIGDELDVFIYLDSEDRMIATTLKPYLQVGEVAYLKVKSVTGFGAFLDWGLEKDLLVPFKEQMDRMEADKTYLVYLYLDEVTDRLVGSAHINKFMAKEMTDMEVGQEVDILVCNPTELGFQVIIDNRYKGLIYNNQIFRNIKTGDRTTGYVQNIREDLKLDIILQKVGYESIDSYADKVHEVLVASSGYLALHDKSDPEAIESALQMSKKNFKKAIGTLYKKRVITIEPEGIRLI